MCTVSWLRGLDRLELFTNRDEQRLRTAAEPPAERRSDEGRRFLAPLDPVGGGTWVAVSEVGLVLCLVNHYQAREPHAVDPLSRGRVVTDLIGAAGLEQALERARALPFERLRGFRLLLLAVDEGPSLLGWDGAEVTVETANRVEPPLISSSVLYPEVLRARRATFAALEREHGGRSAAMLAAFHASERPAPGPLAVSMSRPDAATVSLTRVVVEPGAVRMHYRAGRPSEPGPESVVELAAADGARA